MSRLRTKYVSCPKCGGGLPGEVQDDLVCRCGTDNGMGKADWERIEQALMLRSGSRCEIQSEACMGGKFGDLTALPRHKRSIHHRRPRGMGGDKRADVHSLATLINACGTGTTGCHRYVEINRTWAFERGLLIPKDGTAEVTDPLRVPLTLPGGRRVLLDEYGSYLPVTDGVPWAL